MTSTDHCHFEYFREKNVRTRCRFIIQPRPVIYGQSESLLESKARRFPGREATTFSWAHREGGAAACSQEAAVSASPLHRWPVSLTHKEPILPPELSVAHFSCPRKESEIKSVFSPPSYLFSLKKTQVFFTCCCFVYFSCQRIA